MKREIILDTETTGFDPLKGDRLAEIACVELINHLPTGRTFHKYVNPERSMPEDAAKVHGLTDDFLRDKPKFTEIIDEFLEFVGDSQLVIHNAPFDMKFLSAELTRAGRPPLPFSRAIDTLQMAKNRFPGAPASLDALCKRFGVDNSGRKLHGALIDCDLLAGVYLALIGGRQIGFGLDAAAGQSVAATPGRPAENGEAPARARPGPAPRLLTEAEAEAHAAFVKTLGPNALWLKL